MTIGIYDYFIVHKNIPLMPGQPRTKPSKLFGNRHLPDITTSEKFEDLECVGTTVASTKTAVRICVCVCVCVCVFLKLHITAQSGLVTLVILGGINDTC